MARNSRFRTTSGSSNKPFKGKDKSSDKRSFRKGDDSAKPDRGRNFSDRKSSFNSPAGKGKSFQKPDWRKDDERPESSPQRNPKSFSKSPGTGSKDNFSKPDRGGKSSDRKPPFKPFAGKGKPFQKPGSNDEQSSSDSRRSPGVRRERSFDKKPGAFSKGKPFKKRGPESDESFDKPRVRKSFGASRLDKQRTPQSDNEASQLPPSDLVRLNKYISNSGVCSRREADDLIIAGLITVNGKSVTELGYKVKLTDDVRYEGKRLKAEKPVYVLLNKPKGFITTTDDPQERNTVMQLVQGACKERIYPVGRLDRNTSGLLLLTNDGDLTEKLTHPSHQVKKIYKAELDRPLTKNDFQKIQEGVRLEEGKAIVDDLAIVSDDGKTVGLELHIGWNRIVRRIFETLGYEVVKLDRSVYATLDKKELPRGTWRYLRQDEIIRLKHFNKLTGN